MRSRNASAAFEARKWFLRRSRGMWRQILRGRRNLRVIALLLVVNRSERHWHSVRVRAFGGQDQRFPVGRNGQPAMSMIFSGRLFCIIGKRIGVDLLERDGVIRRSLA